MRPFCGTRRSVMSTPDMILSRLISADCTACGHGVDLVQHAVDAEAHPQVVLGRLEVQVGRAVLDGLLDQAS